MRRFKFGSLLVIGTLLLTSASSAWADVIVVTFPEFSGPVRNPGFPFPAPPDIIATRTFVIPPGEQIVSATLSGTFGNSGSATTARHQLLLDGVLVGSTQDVSPDPFSSLFVPFSFNVPNLSILQDGQVTLSAIQTSEFIIRLSPSTLTITTQSTGAVIPEPSSWALAGVGLLASGVGLVFRHRRRAR